MTNSVKTDRELLELAAKATQDSNIRKSGDVFIVAGIGGGVTYWNPLASDGDALRLAVKLNMDMLITDEWTKIKTSGRHWVQYEGAGLSSIEITRRAIVRAAAEIGRAGI